MQQRNSQSSISVAMKPSKEGSIPSDTDGDVFVPIPNPILFLTISPPAVFLYTKSPFLFPFLYGLFIFFTCITLLILIILLLLDIPSSRSFPLDFLILTLSIDLSNSPFHSIQQFSYFLDFHSIKRIPWVSM